MGFTDSARSVEKPPTGTDSLTDAVGRELNLLEAVSDGVKDAAVRAVTEEKASTAVKVALSAGLGFGLTALTTRAGLGATAGRAILCGLGLSTAMDLNTRGHELSTAVVDTWRSPDNAQRNEEIVRNVLGQFAFDTALMSGAGFAGGYLGNRHFNTYKPIPELTESGFLPPGVHRTNWESFATRFGTNERRLALLDGMEGALTELKLAGVKRAYVGGSFVTAKELPKDFDVTWRTSQSQASSMQDQHPLLFQRLDQAKLYGGEMIPHYRDSEPGIWSSLFGHKRQPKDGGILSFFRFNSKANQNVGVIELDLRTLPVRLPRSFDSLALRQ